MRFIFYQSLPYRPQTFPLELHSLYPTGKIHQLQIWPHHMKFSGNENTLVFIYLTLAWGKQKKTLVWNQHKKKKKTSADIIIIIQSHWQQGFPWHCLYLSVCLSVCLNPSLSAIFPGRSSKLHSVYRQSWFKEVTACQPSLTCPYEGVHGRTSLISSSFLFQLCPACLVCLIRWL